MAQCCGSGAQYQLLPGLAGSPHGEDPGKQNVMAGNAPVYTRRVLVGRTWNQVRGLKRHMVKFCRRKGVKL